VKNISILGSTGSIGRQTLEVISRFPDEFRVLGLAAGRNISLLKEQIRIFKPKIVSVKDQNEAIRLSRQFPNDSVEFHYGDSGAEIIATHPQVDLVVSAMVGSSGLKPTLAALESSKNIALANKEVLVMAGGLLTKKARRKGIKILPVDSEHSAIFQVLDRTNKDHVKRIILTASGGPLRRTPKKYFKDVTLEKALNHPTWSMGKKITIDSATLMNKGFEVIEAKWLFDMEPSKISVWIHPQSIVHSMVEYIDGSIIAQLSSPDMKIPISYALAYPERMHINGKEASPTNFKKLTFEDVKSDKFPALQLAYEAIEEGGTMPAVLNAANEVAVESFLNNELKFIDILTIINCVMSLHTKLPADDIDEIFETDNWARMTALSQIRRRGVK
jgi:1-deoxy-D-xylulose-5-phosphate reductoisomerase